MKLARQKLYKNYAEVTPTMGRLLIVAHIRNPFWKLRLSGKWDKEMDINPEHEKSDTTQYQDPFLMYVMNEFCAKHRCVPVIKPDSIPSNNPVPSTTGSESGQSCFDL